MNTIKNYKCPCCGDTLVFDANTQKLHCESCDTEFELDAMMKAEEAETQSSAKSVYDWGNYKERDYSDGEKINLSLYCCPSCGAEVTGDDTLGATMCPYCGNSTIIKKQFEGSLRPDLVIPFKLDKEAAKKAFREAYSKAPFIPDEFKDESVLDEMTGIYIPFWLFDCDSEAHICYNAERVSTWSDKNYIYTKTDHYKLVRAGKIGFKRVPADGSLKADDTYMEALEPYYYDSAMNFDTAYLSGYVADKYDVGAEESEERANERIRKSTENAFRSTVSNFVGAIQESSSVKFTDGKVRYALLPVWMLNVKYGGNTYKYAINGQTGKTVGDYPISKKKKTLYFWKVYGITFAICAAIIALIKFL